MIPSPLMSVFDRPQSELRPDPPSEPAADFDAALAQYRAFLLDGWNAATANLRAARDAYAAALEGEDAVAAGALPLRRPSKTTCMHGNELEPPSATEIAFSQMERAGHGVEYAGSRLVLYRYMTGKP